MSGVKGQRDKLAELLSRQSGPGAALELHLHEVGLVCGDDALAWYLLAFAAWQGVQSGIGSEQVEALVRNCFTREQSDQEIQVAESILAALCKGFSGWDEFEAQVEPMQVSVNPERVRGDNDQR